VCNENGLCECDFWHKGEACALWMPPAWVLVLGVSLCCCFSLTVCFRRYKEDAHWHIHEWKLRREARRKVHGEDLDDGLDTDADSFIACDVFDGPRTGYAYKRGPRGMGYYRNQQTPIAPRPPAEGVAGPRSRQWQLPAGAAAEEAGGGSNSGGGRPSQQRRERGRFVLTGDKERDEQHAQQQGQQQRAMTGMEGCDRRAQSGQWVDGAAFGSGDKAENPGAATVAVGGLAVQPLNLMAHGIVEEGEEELSEEEEEEEADEDEDVAQEKRKSAGGDELREAEATQ